MKARTPFSETEALLLALDDAEADSGNTDILDAYLEREFLPGELRKLETAADLLCTRISILRLRQHRAARPEGASRAGTQ